MKLEDSETLYQLIRELHYIEENHELPDGDGVTTPVALWAKDWLNKLTFEILGK